MAIATGEQALASDINDEFDRIKRVMKASDETVNNSTTLQNDDDLLFAIGANEIWMVLFYPLVNSPTNADIKFAFTMPTDGVFNLLGIGVDSGNNVSVQFRLTGVASDCQGLDANDMPAVFLGIAVNGANAGNVQLQWAQNTAQAFDTKLLTGSCLIAFKPL